MYGALILFENEFIHIVAISFTALVLTELIMVALTIRTWHHLMILAEILSLALYFLSMIILKEYFGKFYFTGVVFQTLIVISSTLDPDFIRAPSFLWKVVSITVLSCVPLYILKFLRKKFSPPSYSKLT